jgi:hypothetical protein
MKTEIYCRLQQDSTLISPELTRIISHSLIILGNINFNIIPLDMPVFLELSLVFSFSQEKIYTFSSSKYALNILPISYFLSCLLQKKPNNYGDYFLWGYDVT